MDHVKRHLAFAFVSFLSRELKVDGITEVRHDQLKTAQDMIKNAFDLPEDDSLKASPYHTLTPTNISLGLLDD